MADRSRLPILGPDPSLRLPSIAKHQFDTGLRLWTVEHRELPVVSFVLLLPVGVAEDPFDRPGLAAFTADMLDEGSGASDAFAIHERIARIGGLFDTEVGADATLVSLVTLAQFVEPALGLLAEMTTAPRFEAGDVQRVRALRLSRLMQLRDVPAAVAERVLAARLYGTHPYGHTSMGTEASLAAVTAEELRWFHEERYRRTSPVLVAVGDASHEDLVRLVGATWAGIIWQPREGRGAEPDWRGPWKTAGTNGHGTQVGQAGQQAAAVAAADLADLDVRGGRAGAGSGSASAAVDAAAASWTAPERGAPRIAIVDRPGAAQSELRVARVAAARSTPDFHTLGVLNTALGGAFVSRINLNLREEKGYTYGARASFEFRRYPGPFVVQASVQTDATTESVSEILREIDEIASTRPITSDELSRAQAALVRGFPRGFETAEQVARALTQLALYDLDDDYFDRFVPRVRAVTADAVTAAARRYLPTHDMQVVVVGDRARVGASLADLGLGAPIELAAGQDVVLTPTA